MGLLDRFEQRLDRMVNGAFARAFKAEVQPVEIAAAMRRAMDERPGLPIDPPAGFCAAKCFRARVGAPGLAAAVLLWRALPAARHSTRQTITITYMAHMLRRHPVIWAAALFLLLPLVAQEALFIVYGDWMETTFDLSLTGLGLATTLIGLAELSGELTAGWSVDRFGKRPVVALGGVVTAGLFLLIPFTTGSLASALATLVAIFFFFEITVVGALPLLTELVPEARGAVMSMGFGAMAAGRTIGSLVGPAIWGRFGLPGNSVLSAAMMLLAVIVLIRWLREGKS